MDREWSQRINTQKSQEAFNISEFALLIYSQLYIETISWETEDLPEFINARCNFWNTSTQDFDVNWMSGFQTFNNKSTSVKWNV